MPLILFLLFVLLLFTSYVTFIIWRAQPGNDWRIPDGSPHCPDCAARQAHAEVDDIYRRARYAMRSAKARYQQQQANQTTTPLPVYQPNQPGQEGAR